MSRIVAVNQYDLAVLDRPDHRHHTFLVERFPACTCGGTLVSVGRGGRLTPTTFYDCVLGWLFCPFCGDRLPTHAVVLVRLKISLHKSFPWKPPSHPYGTPEYNAYFTWSLRRHRFCDILNDGLPPQPELPAIASPS